MIGTRRRRLRCVDVDFTMLVVFICIMIVLKTVKYYVVILIASSIATLLSLCIYRYASFLPTNREGSRRKHILDKNSISGGLNIERIEHLNRVCHRLNSSDKFMLGNDALDHILVDSEHQLLYCYVPKVACTNWKRIFMVLNGLINSTDILSIPASTAHSRSTLMALSNYTSDDAQYFLESYTKFLFVRHPFERLLSAFRNKLEQNPYSNYFQTRVGRYIVKRYRANARNTSLTNGNDVTFEEFTSYLTQSESNAYNEHWKPIHKLCEPCRIKYDFIGKYETLLSDSQFILRSLGINNLSFPHNIKSASTSKDLKTYFHSLSSKSIKELYQIYELDFKLFSYNMQDLLGYEIS